MSIEEKIANNLSSHLNSINDKIAYLQARMVKVEESYDELLSILKSQLIQVKNEIVVTDDAIQYSRPYIDLSPAKAYDFYLDQDRNFVILDVASEFYERPVEMEEAIKIEHKLINNQQFELPGKNTPILVISEDGTTSILACETLNKLGYYMVYNISGGYKFWPGAQDFDDSDENDEDIVFKVA
jgi:rhodanese-related sulfurtransferase